MTRYRIEFIGRLVGAIGVTSRHTVEVDGETEDAARLKLYETHEHIRVLSVQVIR